MLRHTLLMAAIAAAARASDPASIETTDDGSIVLNVAAGSKVSVSYDGEAPQEVVTKVFLEEQLEVVRLAAAFTSEGLGKRILALEQDTALKTLGNELKEELGDVLESLSKLETDGSDRAKCHAKRQLYDPTTKACTLAVQINCGNQIGTLGNGREDVDCSGKHFYGDTCTSKCLPGYTGSDAQYACGIDGKWSPTQTPGACQDVDECQTNNGGCDNDSGAQCANSVGSSECKCGSGLALDPSDSTKCQATKFNAAVFSFVAADWGCPENKGFTPMRYIGIRSHGDICREKTGHWTPPKTCTQKTGSPFTVDSKTGAICRITGQTSSKWTVPAGVKAIKITALGSGGMAGCEGQAGGKGAWVRATVPVTPGETLLIAHGGPGDGAGVPGRGAGGNPMPNCFTWGGGLVGVFRKGAITQANALVVAGSGGSGGTDMCSHGGDGGSEGSDAVCPQHTQAVGGGGKAKAGGRGGGTTDTKGQVGPALGGGRAGTFGQAGGAGYFGGGGGGHYPGIGGGGGGGGSSFVLQGATSVVIRGGLGGGSNNGGSVIIEQIV